jgi:hypothetical protein
MPATCYSYPADVPSAGRSRGAAQRARLGVRQMPSTCFSYSSDLPAGASDPSGRSVVSWCFSYPPDTPPAPIGLRRTGGSPSQEA